MHLMSMPIYGGPTWCGSAASLFMSMHTQRVYLWADNESNKKGWSPTL